jgi:hypothetical protein
MEPKRILDSMPEDLTRAEGEKAFADLRAEDDRLTDRSRERAEPPTDARSDNR